MSGKKNDRVYLEHILQCIQEVYAFSGGVEETLHETPMAWNATLRQLQIMSESATHLSEKTKAQMTAIDWKRIRGFRNLLVHDYLGDIDPVIIRGVIMVEAPKLEKESRRMLEKLKEQP